MTLKVKMINHNVFVSAHSVATTTSQNSLSVDSSDEVISIWHRIHVRVISGSI